MNKNILKNRKAILSAALVIAATASAFAQGNGIAGINEATSMVSSYFDPGTKLIRRNRLRFRAGNRHRGHQRSHLYGEFEFRPRN